MGSWGREPHILITFMAPFFLMLTFQSLDLKQKKMLYHILLLASGGLCLWGVMQWVGLYIPAFAFARYRPNIEASSYGLQSMTILFAYQLYPLFIFLLSQLIERDGWMKDQRTLRWLTAVVVVLTFINILGSGNRMSLLILLCMSPVLFLRRNFRATLVACVLLPIVVVTAYYVTPAGQRFQQVSTDESVSMRQMLWGAHWKAFLAHPITGVGRSFNSGQMLKDFAPLHFGEGKEVSAKSHNMYLDLLSGLGIAGVFGFLVYYFSVPFYFWRRWMRTRFKIVHSAFLWSLSLAYVSWFLGGVTENSFDVNHNRVQLAVMCALFLYYFKQTAQSAHQH